MRAAVLLPAALLVACTTYGEQAEQVRAKLLGARSSQVSGCLGLPHAVDFPSEGRESWHYSLPLRLRQQDATIEIPTGPYTAPLRPHVVGGSSQTDAMAPGICQLVFELESGSVVDFSARGRGADNLNADAECTLLVRPCSFAP